MTEKLTKRKVKDSACLCALGVSAVLFLFLRPHGCVSSLPVTFEDFPLRFSGREQVEQVLDSGIGAIIGCLDFGGNLVGVS
jgi:hypothetical protein